MGYTSPLMVRLRRRLAQERVNLWNSWRLWRLARQATVESPLRQLSEADSLKPVAFFNASTRLGGISLNAGFAYLAALGLQMAGTPVVYFACRAGMSRCMLGTHRDDPSQPPPCHQCIAQSRTLYSHAPTIWFEFQRDTDVEMALKRLSIVEMSTFTISQIPLGSLVLPGLRWVLRRHQFQDDDLTRALFREFILSAYHLAREFEQFLDLVDPAVLVVFNGVSFPEAIARFQAARRGIRVITHEVGLRAFSAYFTSGEATAYPIAIPEDYELTPEQNRVLDSYLEQRFHGNFTMAGVRFWPEMRPLDANFLAKSAQFHQLVPVFTNVIFDTSQSFANTLFGDMFDWLDSLFPVIKRHPDTLFVIRAHPDESRLGKESRQSVTMWAEDWQIAELPNVVFVPPQEYLSSYDLIQRSKFILVYNSSIGLEASLLGVPVLCAGKARYTQYPTVFFPQDREAYWQQMETFLSQGEIKIPSEHQRWARIFLYYQLFRVSLPVDQFLQEGDKTGYVRLKPFSVRQLMPGCSPTIDAVVEGILNDVQIELPLAG
jgi:hypothetical protein